MLDDITLKEFESLSDNEKSEALWEYGEIIDHRFENEFRIMLYQISNFYCEVVYDDTNEELVEYRAFDSTVLLSPYLNSIDISGITDNTIK
jgi:hypothetical protein